MEEFEDIINEIKQGKQIELSWTSTTLATKFAAITVLFADFFFIYFFKCIEQNVIIIIALFVFLNIYAGLQFFYSCEAYLKGKTLSIKKVFRKEININIETILEVNSFTIKSTKFTIIKYELDGRFEWASITNSNSIIFGIEYSAAEIIKIAKNI